MESERFTPHGEGLFTGQGHAKESDALNARFIFPPFSVLDARGGAWRQRKRAWLSLGIESEVGRGEALTYHTSYMRSGSYANKGTIDSGEGHKTGLTYTDTRMHNFAYYREKEKGKTETELEEKKVAGTSVF